MVLHHHREWGEEEEVSLNSLVVGFNNNSLLCRVGADTRVGLTPMDLPPCNNSYTHN